MSVEQWRPGNVAGYMDLEKCAEQLQAELVAEFDGHLAEYNALYDVDFEMQGSELAHYASLLGTMLVPEPCPQSEVVAYSSAMFGAYLTTRLVTSGEWGLRFEEFYDVAHAPELHDKILDITQTYLQYRPTLDALIGRYVGDIDSTGRYTAVAETIAGLLCVHAEEFQYARFMDSVQEPCPDIIPADWL